MLCRGLAAAPLLTACRLVCASARGSWLSARSLSAAVKDGPGVTGNAIVGTSRSGSSSGIEHEAAIVLPMPKLSHAMTSGRVARWHVKEGAPVAMYDVLLTVETETLVEEAYRVDQFAGKVSLLVESQEEGHVAALLVGEGEEVPVGRPIALLCERPEEVRPLREAAAAAAAARTGAAAAARVEEGARDGLARRLCDGNVYEQQRPGAPRLRLLEWQSYLAEGPRSSGCL